MPFGQDLPRDESLNLYVVRYHGDTESRFKHWSLYVDGPCIAMKEQHQIFSVECSNYFRYQKTGRPHDWTTDLFELTLLGSVSTDLFFTTGFVAENMPIDSYHWEWDGQNYVMDLLGHLEAAGVIDPRPEEQDEYRRIKYYLEGYMHK